jgi:chromosome segregation ATPase
MNNIVSSKKLFRLHWGDCQDEISLLNSLADNIHQDMKAKALEFELVRQERDDFRKKYADLLDQYNKQEKQICNLEHYSKELETRLSYVKPAQKEVSKDLKEYRDRRGYCMKNKRGPKPYLPRSPIPFGHKRNKSSLLADLLS